MHSTFCFFQRRLLAIVVGLIIRWKQRAGRVLLHTTAKHDQVLNLKLPAHISSMSQRHKRACC